MRVGVTQHGLRIRDGDEVVCHVDTDGWETARDAPALDRTVDATVTGRTSGVRFPPGWVSTPSPRPDGGNVAGCNPAGPVGSGNTQVRIDSSVTFFLATNGDAIVERSPEAVDVSVDPATTVTIGLRRLPERASRSMTVPDTAEGLATALTTLGQSAGPTSPARSDPARRTPLPAIESGAELDAPTAISNVESKTGIVLTVPSSFESLYVLAPLAYYLGARVRLADREQPVIAGPSIDDELVLSGVPHLQAEVASLLYRTVVLDSLVRTATEDSASDAHSLLAELDIDPETLRTAPLAERFDTYRDAPIEMVDSSLPEWPLSMYVRPTAENVSALSQVLDRLAFVYLPESSSLDLEDRLHRSLEDFYRSGAEAPTVEPILPDLHRGRIHGWAADGVPIDAFTYLPAAYEHRQDTPTASPDGRTLTVVVNDADMDREATRLEERYGSDGPASDVDLRLERNLDRESLAAVIAEPTTIFHYVGHCEEAGLRCADGYLPLSRLEHSGARAFFLNACGSYHEGVALVRNGSIAGGVTLRPVLDEQATRVGTAFTQLLLAGFPVERALRIACRRSIMNKDYVVVGDGSYSVTGRMDGGELVHVSECGGQFHLDVDDATATSIGELIESTTGDRSSASDRSHRDALERDEVAAFLDRRFLPVIFRDQFFWGRDFARRLRDDELPS